MGNQKLNNLFKDPRTNWKFIWIVVILGFLAASGILVYYYLWIADLEAKIAALEVRLPEKVIPEKVTKDETANWKTYRNERYTFEFQYPGDWTVQEDINGLLELKDQAGTLMISISGIDRTVVGITYCEAYPEDKPRCERFKIRNIPGTIDWEVDGKANALFMVTNEFGLSVTLHQVNSKTKALFRLILSTFEFIK